MNRSRYAKSALALLLASAVAVSGCSRKAPKILPPDPGGAVATETSGVGQGPVPGTQADFAATLMGQDAVYFDTDKYNIDSEAGK